MPKLEAQYTCDRCDKPALMSWGKESYQKREYGGYFYVSSDRQHESKTLYFCLLCTDELLPMLTGKYPLPRDFDVARNVKVEVKPEYTKTVAYTAGTASTSDLSPQRFTFEKPRSWWEDLSEDFHGHLIIFVTVLAVIIILAHAT